VLYDKAEKAFDGLQQYSQATENPFSLHA